MKKWIALVSIALILMMGLSALAEGATISAHGVGTVGMTADHAVITFGVRRSSTDIAEAQSYVNETLSRALDRLREKGVTDEDICTRDIRISEDYSYSADGMFDQKQPYIVENNVSVTIRDIDSVGDCMDAVFAAGVNSFTELRFAASDTKNESRRAMALAVEDARTHAEVLAGAAGMKLGAVLSITDSGESGYYYPMSNGLYEKMEAEADAGGFANVVFNTDLQVSATATLVYELLPMDE